MKSKEEDSLKNLLSESLEDLLDRRTEPSVHDLRAVLRRSRLRRIRSLVMGLAALVGVTFGALSYLPFGKVDSKETPSASNLINPVDTHITLPQTSVNTDSGYALIAETNIKDGASVVIHISSPQGETPSFSAVKGGRIVLLEQDCTTGGRGLIENISISIEFSPRLDTSFIRGPQTAAQSLTEQPEAVYEVYGENFEMLAGPQVVSEEGRNLIRASRSYDCEP